MVSSSVAPSRDGSSLPFPPRLNLIRPVADMIREFPATRYYGSKRRLLGWMYGHLASLRFGTVLDVFGGTASVSLLFKAMGKTVTFHDGFNFNGDVAASVLADDFAMDRQSVEEWLAAVSPCDGVVTRNFTGVFFTNDENGWLDGFAARRDDGHLCGSKRRLLNYLVYQACLKKRPFNIFHRANLGLRTAVDVKRSFGNASTWEKSFAHHALKAYDELAVAPTYARGSAVVLPAGDASGAAPGYDLVYLDPPYISCVDRYVRDDYWRRYHFLEGLARYSTWEASIDRTSDVRLFPAPEWFRGWAKPASHKERLFSLIDAHRQSIVVLSYVSGTSPSEVELLEHFESRFANVSLHTTSHSHALSKSKMRELLFVGVPR